MATFIVIDDSKLARQKQIESITAAGHEVIGEAENGEIGVEIYKNRTPDFVILDIEMPVMNGLETTKQIRLIDPSAKIIIASSVVNKTAIAEIMNAGALAQLKKPFKSEMLQHQIARYLTMK